MRAARSTRLRCAARSGSIKPRSLVEESLKTNPTALQQRFGGLPTTRIAIEAGTQSPWANAMLRDLGHEVFVANPRKVRAIYDSDNKSDRVDAEQLARFARMDPKLLSPIAHRSMAARADLAVLRSRSALVDARTQLINHVRGSTKPFGVRLPASSTPTFARHVAWRIPRELRPALVPVLRTIAELTAASSSSNGASSSSLPCATRRPRECARWTVSVPSRP